MKTTEPLHNIAISFSGGGYRAAAYNLGVLSYLHTLRLGDETLLHRVKLISTISGGTITGMRYALSLAKDEPFETFYKELYAFLADKKLMDEAFKMLNTPNNWAFPYKSKNLINACATIYQSELFKGAHFDTLLAYNEATKVEFMFNTTNIETAKPFRFQVSATGIIGNKEHRVSEKNAKDLRLGDIVAASSCFPGGFEPMIFPHDFLDNTEDFIKNKTWYPKQLRLMDGGIADNQGIESMWLAEKRLAKETGYFIGTYIISDVRKEMTLERIKTTKPPTIWGKLSLFNYFIGVLGVLIGAVLLLLYFSSKWLAFAMGIVITLSTLFVVVYLSVQFYVKKIIKGTLGQETPQLIKDLKILFNINISTLWRLIRIRMNALMQLFGTVFLERIRHLHYDKTYDEDKDWAFRTCSNLIYHLPKNGSKIEVSPNVVGVSIALKKVVLKANKMKTTLWFTDKETIKNERLNDLIVTGQATICSKLIAYLNVRLEKSQPPTDINKEYYPLTNETKTEIQLLLNQLNADFVRFNENPYWLIEKHY